MGTRCPRDQNCRCREIRGRALTVASHSLQEQLFLEMLAPLVLWSYCAQPKPFLTVTPTALVHRYAQFFLPGALGIIFALRWGCAMGLEESYCRSPSLETGQSHCTLVWLAHPFPQIQGWLRVQHGGEVRDQVKETSGWDAGDIDTILSPNCPKQIPLEREFRLGLCYLSILLGLWIGNSYPLLQLFWGWVMTFRILQIQL